MTQTTTLKGKPLPPGGTIGVPAPAFAFHNRSEILRGVEWWEQRGYKVKLAEGIYERKGYVAGDPETRAKGVTAMFADPEVDLVMCSDAGFGSAHTIPYIDFEVIRANPKPFVGYSDITSLHTSIRHYTGLVTFVGPLLCDIAHKETKPFTQERFLRAVTSEEPLGDMPRHPEDGYIRSFNSGTATGEMVGGCLWLLAQNIGTPWQIDLEDKIFFFEDVDSPPWYIDGQLTQMKHAGLLDGVLGIVISEMARCDWKQGRADGWPGLTSLEDVFEEHLEPLGVPIVYGFPMGHGDYLATTPLGVDVTIDADKGSLTFNEPALESR